MRYAEVSVNAPAAQRQTFSYSIPSELTVDVGQAVYVPFGQKTGEQLNQIAGKITRFLIQKHDIQALVIACNTATVSSLDYLRHNFSIPIIGAVPVVKPACEQSKNKRIALLVTAATGNSDYLKNLIRQHANGAEVKIIVCPGLADLIDAGDLDAPAVHEVLQRFLAPALEHNADVIGLGCTQYPFLRKQIQNLIPPHVLILDSNEPVAKQVERVIKALPEYTTNNDHVPTYTFYVTKDAPQFCTIAQKLVGPIVHECIALTL